MKFTIKRLSLLLILLVLFFIVGYNRDIIGNNPRIRNAEIDHGYSAIYTMEEIDLAMKVVLEEFGRKDWNNELIRLWYDEEMADLVVQRNRHLQERLQNETIERGDIIILFAVFDEGQGLFQPRLRQYWMWYLERDRHTGDWRITNQGKLI